MERLEHWSRFQNTFAGTTPERWSTAFLYHGATRADRIPFGALFYRKFHDYPPSISIAVLSFSSPMTRTAPFACQFQRIPLLRFSAPLS